MPGVQLHFNCIPQAHCLTSMKDQISKTHAHIGSHMIIIMHIPDAEVMLQLTLVRVPGHCTDTLVPDCRPYMTRRYIWDALNGACLPATKVT